MSENGDARPGRGVARRGVCNDCGRTDPLTEDGVCGWCAQPDEEAVEALRKAFADVVDEYDFPTAFWSLDRVYDENDGEMRNWSGSDE